MSEGKGGTQVLDYQVLRSAVESDDGVRLQSVGRVGGTVYPPMYAGAVYAMERRRVRMIQVKEGTGLAATINAEAARWGK